MTRCSMLMWRDAEESWLCNWGWLPIYTIYVCMHSSKIFVYYLYTRINLKQIKNCKLTSEWLNSNWWMEVFAFRLSWEAVRLISKVIVTHRRRSHGRREIDLLFIIVTINQKLLPSLKKGRAKNQTNKQTMKQSTSSKHKKSS